MGANQRKRTPSVGKFHRTGMETTNNALHTIEEAADLLRTSVGYMYRLTSSRRIGHYKIGRELRFSQEHLDEYLASVAVPTRKKLGRPRRTEAA